MRGPDTFTESLFTLRKLEDFVPPSIPYGPSGRWSTPLW